MSVALCEETDRNGKNKSENGGQSITASREIAHHSTMFVSGTRPPTPFSFVSVPASLRLLSSNPPSSYYCSSPPSTTHSAFTGPTSSRALAKVGRISALLFGAVPIVFLLLSPLFTSHEVVSFSFGSQLPFCLNTCHTVIFLLILRGKVSRTNHSFLCICDFLLSSNISLL